MTPVAENQKRGASNDEAENSQSHTTGNLEDGSQLPQKIHYYKVASRTGSLPTQPEKDDSRRVRDT